MVWRRVDAVVPIVTHDIGIPHHFPPGGSGSWRFCGIPIVAHNIVDIVEPRREMVRGSAMPTMLWATIGANSPRHAMGIRNRRVGNGAGFHDAMSWLTIRIPKTRQLATIPWRSGTVGWEMMRVSAMAAMLWATIGIPQKRQLPAIQWRNDAGFRNVHNVVGNNWDSAKASTPRHTTGK